MAEAEDSEIAAEAALSRLVRDIKDLRHEAARLAYPNTDERGQMLAILQNIPGLIDTAIMSRSLYASDISPFIYKNLNILSDIADDHKRAFPVNFRNNREFRSSAGLKVEQQIEKVRVSLALFERQYKFPSPQEGRPVVPPQNPAPVRVSIDRAGKLILAVSQTHTGSVSSQSLDVIRQSIHEILSSSIEQMSSSSNIDPRLVPACRGLLKYLSMDMGEMPVEALGLNYQISRRSFSVVRDTVPDIIAEQLDQIFTTLSVILNQYEEWKLYLSAEAATHVSKQDMPVLIEQAEKLVEFLEANETQVDPGIPARLKEMCDSYTQGLVNIESISVPLLESFGNVFSEVSRFLLDQYPGAVGYINTPGTTIVLTGVAITVIEKFAPTMSNFGPLKYLKDMVVFIHKNFSPLKETIEKLSK